MTKRIHRVFPILLGAALLLPGEAMAKSTIAVLAFGGKKGASARKRLVSSLKGQYRVIHGDKVLDACDELGISMSRGRKLARCAQRAGARAVIGGAVGGDILSLVIFSGKTGKVVKKGSVVCEGRLSAADLRDALSIVQAGLRKVPSGGRAPRAKPRPRPRPKPRVVDEPEPDDGLEFDPDSKDESDKGDFSFEPDPVDRPPKKTARVNPDEDPLDGGSYKPGDSDPDRGTRKTTDAKVTKKVIAHDGYPRLLAVVGLGTWIRDFSLHDPARTTNPSTGKPWNHPGYNSSAAFALRLAAKARPAAFFTDGFASWLYLRMQFQTTLGLQSLTKENGVEKTYGTSFLEFIMDAGVDWNILKKPTSPHLVAGIGGGMMDFSIDWESDPPHTLPDASYGFFLIRAGVNWPFHSMVGAHFNFDYRVVGGSGEVEDSDHWYGPSSTGGINLALGIDGAYKGFIASLEYTYTRYFYAFTEAEDRVSANKRAAGGALDILHGFVFSVGYAF